MRTNRTRSQERILHLLKHLNRSLSAQDIYLELRGLKREGLVHVRTLASGESLYGAAHQDQHHLTCLECGASIPINECPVHHLESQLQQSHSFKIYYHTLEFFGLCDRCTLAQQS
ncbi:MAG: transcriptional repressor [Oscillatoriales cyanobacterium]|nr:MAG: transcriptional repressor [Oscillatoriales cyanobacterium]